MPILRNKYFLYVVVILALVSILGYLSAKRYDCLAIFAVVGLLCTYFCKNMCVTLLVAIVVTAALCNNANIMEGFKEGNEHNEKEAKDEKKEGMHHKDEKKEGMDNKDKDKEGMNNKDGEHCWLEDKINNDIKDKSSCEKENGCWGSKNTCGKGKEAMSVAATAASVNGKDNDSSPGKRIDYASTIENAYDNLDKMLGSEGIKGLTNDSKALMEQQKMLMDTMSNMQPFLEKAKEAMDMIPSNMKK